MRVTPCVVCSFVLASRDEGYIAAGRDMSSIPLLLTGEVGVARLVSLGLGGL